MSDLPEDPIISPAGTIYSLAGLRRLATVLAAPGTKPEKRSAKHCKSKKSVLVR